MTAIKDLRITLVQADLVWESKAQNLSHFDALLNLHKPETDIIVLPEMFATGFSMNAPALAETENGETVLWLKNLAKKHHCVCTGSIITKDGDQYYNRLYWMQPDGTFETYDKRHLFSFANEEAHYSAGQKRLIVELNGWKICPMICYDLRFPVWSRNQDLTQPEAATAYDLLIYVANWPEARRKPWQTLLEARAHENQVYVAGVNRVGLDGNQIVHSGDSGVYSPKGDLLSHLKSHQEGVETIMLSYQELSDFKEKFTVWKDKDRFELKI
ncbi:MAG: amidohydrolase [Salibacteraceae bacterium]|nr:amidohydrolase [Salibacteraceae bacterium]